MAAARGLVPYLLLQDMIGLAAWVSGYHLHWASGLLMALCLEAVLSAALLVALREVRPLHVSASRAPLVMRADRPGQRL